ncbi:MAG TPA: formyltransferase family protein [Gemmatimonadaceae bacterium]|nr:formyltransferase family protein [Gemmatimonadaceae bacterium]
MPSPPLRVAILSSDRAPGLATVLAHALHGPLFEIAGVVSSEPAFADAQHVLAAGLPLVHRPIREFHRGLGSRLSDMNARAAYDERLAELLSLWRADLVLCCSYLYILTEPVLDRWRGAVLSVHHSDLLDRTRGGAVRYRGLRAVRDAIMDGATETRSSVHVVTRELDDGPTLVRSWAFPVSPLVRDMRERGAVDALKAYAFAHQEWMLQVSWGPLMVCALELAALDRSGLTTGRYAGAPWELTADGELQVVREAELSGRTRVESLCR